MNQINTIEELLAFLDKAVTECQVKKTELLTKFHKESSIYKIIVQLKKGEINEISLPELKKIMEDFGIEEYDLFLKLKRVLERYDMLDSLTNTAETKKGPDVSRDDAIQYILTFVSDLQDLLEDKNLLEEETISELENQGIETELIDNFKRILVAILRELEIKRVLETDEYKQLYQKGNELTEISSLIKKSTSSVLSQTEKDIIYSYLRNSTIEDKLSIYISLVSSWLEQIRTSTQNKGVNPENIVLLVEPITEDLIEKVQQNLETQKVEIQMQTPKKTKDDWSRLFEETLNIIRENTKLTSNQKNILEKIILNSTNIPQEDLNLYEELLNYHEEISLEGRKKAYSDLKSFDENDCGTISIDLAQTLIPNLDSSSSNEITKIIEYIIDKYNQCYLSREEIQEVNELIISIQENYADLSYVEYSDPARIYLEERFVELDGNKERLINAARYNDTQLEEGYDAFIENTFKKIIKTKLDELMILVNNNTEDLELIKKGEIPNLKNQLEYWLNKYSEYSTTKEIKEPYRQYTIEDIQNIDFSNQNAIIFLNGENGMTLYEEGILHNGLNQNGSVQTPAISKAADVIKKAVTASREHLNPNHSKFASYIEKNRPSKNDAGTSKDKPNNHVMIADHYLIRLSSGDAARVSAIELNNTPDVNKEKIGIHREKNVLLIIGLREINHNQKSKEYGRMIDEAKEHENTIMEIVQAFENPNTSKEILLGYIARSYGILEKILNGKSTRHSQPRRGGKL